MNKMIVAKCQILNQIIASSSPVSSCWKPIGKNYRKSNAEECIFAYIALYFECRFNKNSLLKNYLYGLL